MKLWLDDVRHMPFDFDVHVKTAADAMLLIARGVVHEVSLDHDLGMTDHRGNHPGTGRDVANFIEEGAFVGAFVRIKWAVHSANVYGAEAMEQALRNADKYWDKWERGEM